MAYPDRRIVRRPCPPIPAELGAVLHPVLARVCAARAVCSARELDHSLALLHPFGLLSQVEPAVDLLARALREGWRVLVVGDFDADGATSTAVAVRALRLFGADAVDFLVPNRFEFGYGLTPEIVEVALGRNPDLIITVDNGISSIEGVARARAAGVRVLVTDHHLPGRVLPEADAIVNPNQPGDPFPSKHLAGVGVIFYLMLALRARLRDDGWFGGGAAPNLAHLLDLVALGTVADVVPLDHNNRILVAQGLARIRAGKACPGIRALATVARRNPARAASSDLGFAIGPRLNAAGRMHDMALGIRCLLADDDATAQRLAEELDRLNRERRQVEGAMREEAAGELSRMRLDRDGDLPYGLCLYDPHWHEGVIGILASRVKEQVNRPVVIFTDSGDGMVRGSARSVPGLHIRDALDAVAVRHPGLLRRFGGHAMAAGLTIARADVDAFRAAFDTEVRRHLSAADLYGVVSSDGPLTATDAQPELAEQLKMALPWGQGFLEPVFDGAFEVVRRRVVAERHLKLTLRWSDAPTTVDAICFDADLAAWGRPGPVDLAYRLDLNEFRGERAVQLVVEHLVGG